MTTYVVNAACDVKYLADTGGDFSNPDLNITIDSFNGAGTAEGANTPIIDGILKLRITNTSGCSDDFALLGVATPTEQV